MSTRSRLKSCLSLHQPASATWERGQASFTRRALHMAQMRGEVEVSGKVELRVESAGAVSRSRSEQASRQPAGVKPPALAAAAASWEGLLPGQWIRPPPADERHSLRSDEDASRSNLESGYGTIRASLRRTNRSPPRATANLISAPSRRGSGPFNKRRHRCRRERDAASDLNNKDCDYRQTSGGRGSMSDLRGRRQCE